MVLARLEKQFGLPPLKEITTILSGDNGRQINSILSKLEKISHDQSAIVEAIALLRVVQELGRTGDLERLDSILKNIPHGKEGQELISEVRKLLTDLSEKLDKLSSLATTLLSKGD